MEICHAHNLNRRLGQPKRFGIRVALPRADTFAGILGKDWERYHWYTSPGERDHALEDMASEHRYSRRGDKPTLIFEAVDLSSETGAGG